jgi:hypothetical protein
MGSLQDNGGATVTRAIPGMVIANKAAAHERGGAGCGSVDQRGETAPVGDCDIGAFEVQ